MPEIANIPDEARDMMADVADALDHFDFTALPPADVAPTMNFFADRLAEIQRIIDRANPELVDEL